MGMRRVLAMIALLPLAALAACGSDSDSQEDDTVAEGTESPDNADGTDGDGDGEEGPPRYEFVGTVLENGDHGPELCPGVMAMSYPPQCGGVPTEGWSWEGVPGVQQEGGTTWAEVRVVGTYDGRVFVPGGEVRAPEPDEYPGGDGVSEQDYAPACEDHPVVDDARVADTDFQAANAATDAHPAVSATWVSYGERPPEEWVLNVAVTEDAAGVEAELRALWGGGLCVVERDQPTADELAAIGEQVPEVLGEDVTIVSTGPSVLTGQVLVTVVAATDEMQQALDERFGPGVVRLDGYLSPVD